MWVKTSMPVFAMTLRRKSKQALRDYKKVQIQLENLETSVRDRCKKEFTGKQYLIHGQSIILFFAGCSVFMYFEPLSSSCIVLISFHVGFSQISWQKWWISPVIWLAQGSPSWITSHMQRGYFFPVTGNPHCIGTWMSQRVEDRLWSRVWCNYRTSLTASCSSPRYALGSRNISQPII